MRSGKYDNYAVVSGLLFIGAGLALGWQPATRPPARTDGPKQEIHASDPDLVASFQTRRKDLEPGFVSSTIGRRESEPSRRLRKDTAD